MTSTHMKSVFAIAGLLITTTCYADGFWSAFAAGIAGAAEASSDIQSKRIESDLAIEREKAALELRERLERERYQREANTRQPTKEAEMLKIAAAYPRWMEMVKDPEYNKWMSGQPKSVQAIARPKNADQAILILDLYDKDTQWTKKHATHAASLEPRGYIANSTKQGNSCSANVECDGKNLCSEISHTCVSTELYWKEME